MIFASQLVLGEGKMRRWTDVDGRKVEGRLVAFTGSDQMVTLELRNGSPVRFPIQRLGPRDRAYVREHAPIDLATASTEIDRMIWDGLKTANADIKKLQAEVAADSEMDAAEKKKEINRLLHMERMTHPTKPLSDELFMRRVYLDIAGRIPTHDEAERFLRKRTSQAARNQLIDELIDSEAFVSHFFNYLGDLLRIRDGISMEGFENLKSGAYADWVKDQIRLDRPWDEFVSALLTAGGYLWENPATGYFLTDYGMELCNLSNTFTTFAGTEITCAQCHDHPFEDVYQIDFYRMASFFGSMAFQANPQDPIVQAINAKKPEFAAEAKKAKQNTNALNTFLGAYNMNLRDTTENSTALPFDYKYDNGEPYQKISPGVYFGEMVSLERSGGPRQAFAEWLTSEGNPRFTINIVNRLWKHVFGIAQIEPVDNIPGHLDGQAQNYELLKYLENLMKEVDYSMKNFLRVLYKTESYQREACYHSPTLAMIDRGEFHFPAPILRRLSAEQMWDSLVAMAVDDPESSDRRSRILEAYQEIMSVDWRSMTYKDALAKKAEHDRLGTGAMMMSNNRGRNSSPDMTMIRASELPQPNRVGSFLYLFGQSDKKFIENGNTDGTIPQVMMLLNGALTNRVMSDQSKHIVEVARDERDPDEGARAIFLSILSRYPEPQERELIEKLVRGGGKGGGPDYSDLIWALLNTREFMFIQ